jgi:hypothetical protein
MLRYITIQVLVTLFVCTSSYHAQNIGQFPAMNGSFENETDTVLQMYSIPSGGVSSHWATSSTLGQSKIIREKGRSGPAFLRIDLTSSNSKDIETPSVTGDGSAGGLSSIVNGTIYTVQFYYRTSSNTKPASGKKVGISSDGRITLNFDTVTFFATNGQWKKVTRNITAARSNVYPRYGIGLIRYTLADTVDIDIDDFVVYAAGKADTIPPGAPTAATFTSVSTGSLALQWKAPLAGIDTGGYMVVRGVTAPSHQPNINGIYAVGNEIFAGEKVVYTGNDTSFTDSGLVAGTTYYYSIYTVDKAFNYSESISLAGKTQAAKTTAVITIIPQGIYNNISKSLNLNDTVTIYLASMAAPYELIDSAKCVLDSLSFRAVADYTINTDGAYFVVVRHRSSIETWSARELQFAKGDTVYYDFTTDAAKAYGNNLIRMDNKYCMYSGDVNQDGYVDPLDIARIDQDSYLYIVGRVVTDINGDGYVDPLDLSLADGNSFNYAGVKKPTTARSVKPGSR